MFPKGLARLIVYEMMICDYRCFPALYELMDNCDTPTLEDLRPSNYDYGWCKVPYGPKWWDPRKVLKHVEDEVSLITGHNHSNFWNNLEIGKKDCQKSICRFWSCVAFPCSNVWDNERMSGTLLRCKFLPKHKSFDLVLISFSYAEKPGGYKRTPNACQCTFRTLSRSCTVSIPCHYKSRSEII